jgi:hypothetical protein
MAEVAKDPPSCVRCKDQTKPLDHYGFCESDECQDVSRFFQIGYIKGIAAGVGLGGRIISET